MPAPKAPGWRPRPRLGCCSWDCDSYEEQRRGDPKSLGFKSRAARRATAERERSPHRRLRRLGFSTAGRRLQPAVTELWACALGLRGDARAAASAASVSARATAARGAAGSRKIWKMEEAEPAGGDGRAGKAEPEDGEEKGSGAGSLALARRPARGAAPRPAASEAALAVVGNRGHAGHGGGMAPRPAPSLAGASRSPAPRRPEGPTCARRARLCEVVPIVQRGRLAPGRRGPGGKAFSLQSLV